MGNGWYSVEQVADLLDLHVRTVRGYIRDGKLKVGLDLQADLRRLGVMREAAAALIGEHDFTSFRASACQAHSPVKDLRRIEIVRRGAYWRFEFEASAFLHHMIRNIMGCLIAVGTGNRPPHWMAEVLAARSRDAAAPTFSPDGLYFLGPVYDASWNIPDRTPAFDWLP